MKTLKEFITLNPYNTFVIIKPGFVKLAKEIIGVFLNNGYTISKYGAKRLTYNEAKELYKVHKDKPFYDDLCKYMSGGISIGYCLNCSSSKEVIKKTNKLKDDIRKTYGKDDMKNAIHSSDSERNVVRESNIYFKNVQ